MSEIDYQMALLLQHKFEQECKQKKFQKTDTGSDYIIALALQEEGSSSKNAFTPSLTDSDQVLALKLQEDFKREAEVERPANNLVYKPLKNVGSSKCLVDPSWEVIDPTPDIHVLFIAFNDRFFWGTLGSVTVSWSKRMTTCAGICSYQGHGGMCSITLSEPLLKLRPRKDLVETLLHEMIHAYLFVTNNNRDRDGHGPEFHKHMYRINAEAGTNITVYHDFHDEVKLYQQHWWRCDGPCQQRRPYFGMVRRAMNRPPGPNDNWWADHQRNCGGNFIKVKEPQKPAKVVTKKAGGKTAKTPTPTTPGNDIRNYIPVQNKGVTNENKENKFVNSKTDSGASKPETKNIPKIIPPNNNRTSSIVKPNTTITNPATNVHGILNHNSNSKISNVIPSKINNIYGFTNLNTPSSTKSGGSKPPGIKGVTKNAGSSTFVVNKKSGTVVKNDDIHKPLTSVTETFNGSGHTLTSSRSTSEVDYSVVRNHWLNKFDNASKDVKNKSLKENNKNGIKRTNSTPIISSLKAPKLSLASEKDSVEKSECPICKKQTPINELNDHLDDCLGSKTEDLKECIICGKHVNAGDYELHVSKCCEDNFKDTDDVFEVEDDKKCSKCGKKIKHEYFDSHFELCGDDIMDLTKSSPSTSRHNGDNKNCPVCKLSLDKSKYDRHVEQCLMNMFDGLEEKYDIKIDEKTPCLACGKEILKSDLDAHLEECMNMSNVFDTTNVTVIEDDEDDGRKDSSEDSFNCPICLQLVLEKDMQAHLDKCLNEVHESEEAEKNKSIVLSSFNDDDYLL